MKNKHEPVFFSAILISALLMSCGGGAAASDQPAPEPQSQPFVNLNDDIVSASAEVVAGKWATLAFLVNGQKVEVNVSTGEQVKSGKVLATLPDDALPQIIINAQGDLILAQKALDDLLNYSDTALAQAAISLRDAKKEYDSAVDHRESLEGLITIEEITTTTENTPFGPVDVKKVKKYKGYANRVTIAKADESVALKKAILDDAQREFDRLSNIQRSAEVAAAQARVAAIEATINQSKLTAPFDGTVIELYLNSGEIVSPGAPVLLLADLSTLQVITTDLNEVDVARVQIGDPVKVTFDAIPDTSVTGKVTEIAMKNAPGSGVYFNVTIALDETPAALRWGMSAFVEIQVSK